MPIAVPTGAPDPPNKIRLVLELYGLFFDELFGHVPERPHSSSQPLDQARDMPPYHRMMVRVVLFLLMPVQPVRSCTSTKKIAGYRLQTSLERLGSPAGAGGARVARSRLTKDLLGQINWYQIGDVFQHGLALRRNAASRLTDCRHGRTLRRQHRRALAVPPCQGPHTHRQVRLPQL